MDKLRIRILMVILGSIAWMPTGLANQSNPLQSLERMLTQDRQSQSNSLQPEVLKFVQAVADSSPELKEAQSKLAATNEAIDNAQASYHPVIVGTARGTKLDSNDNHDQQFTQSYNQSLGIRLSQNIWRGGIDSIGVDKAKLQNKLQENLAKEVELSLQSQTVFEIYEINHLALQLKLQDYVIENADRLLSLAKRKQAAGLGGKIDVLQAQVQRDRSLAKREQLRGSLKSKTDYVHLRLGNLSTNADLLEPVLKEPLLTPLINLDAQEVSIKETNARLQVDLSEADLTTARRGRYLPSLDLNADIQKKSGWSRSDSTEGGFPSQRNDSRSVDTQVGLVLTIPLWDARKGSQIPVSAQNKIATQLRLEGITQQTERARIDIFNKINNLRGRKQTARATYESSKSLYEAQLRLYEAGAVDIFSLLDAENGVVSALEAWLLQVNSLQLQELRWHYLTKGYVFEG